MRQKTRKKLIHIIGSNGREGPCEVCGVPGDLRPYGKNGAYVCFSCGMKDQRTARKQFNKILDTLHNNRKGVSRA